jgi:hypothetical protein
MTIITVVDFVITLTNLSEMSDSCRFVEPPDEPDQKSCGITFFKDSDTATLGMVYNKTGATGTVFNGQLEVVAQMTEKLSLEEYWGIRNYMLKVSTESAEENQDAD